MLDFFIRRPVFCPVIAVMIVLVGALAGWWVAPIVLEDLARLGEGVGELQSLVARARPLSLPGEEASS